MYSASNRLPQDASVRLGRSHPAHAPGAVRQAFSPAPFSAEIIAPADVPLVAVASQPIDVAEPRWRPIVPDDDEDSLFDNVPV